MKRVRHIYAKSKRYTVKVTLDVTTGKDNSKGRPEFIDYMEWATARFVDEVAMTAVCPNFKVKVK